MTKKRAKILSSRVESLGNGRKVTITTEIVDTPPDWSKTAQCGCTGRHIADVPEPHQYFWDKQPRKREVLVTVTRYWGQGEHYYVDMKEEDNAVWCRLIERPYDKAAHWRRCWDDPKTSGRSFSERCNTEIEARDFITATWKENFKDSTHELVQGYGGTERWFYKDGD